jgi:hypothetical protein
MPDGRHHDRSWWVPQLVGLSVGAGGTIGGWALVGGYLALYVAFSCGTGDVPAPGARCPSGHYIALSLWPYAIPVLLSAGGWLLPRDLRWRPARIVLVVVLAAAAIPAIAAVEAFDHSVPAT